MKQHYFTDEGCFLGSQQLQGKCVVPHDRRRKEKEKSVSEGASRIHQQAECGNLKVRSQRGPLRSRNGDHEGFLQSPRRS
jgi:hypothetical protein